jgi:hypothetical protein
VSTQQAETYQIIYSPINLYTPHVTAENHQALISSEVHITEYWQYDMILYIYKLQLGCHVEAVHIYTKQHTEQHK